eukprot:91148_1
MEEERTNRKLTLYGIVGSVSIVGAFLLYRFLNQDEDNELYGVSHHMYPTPITPLIEGTNTMDHILVKVKKILKAYDIDHTNGFLRSRPPLRTIPLDRYPKYAVWEQTMSELSQLVIAQSFKRRVLSMPIISDISDLLSANLDIKRRALTVLSFFVNAFINETQIVDYKNPKQKPLPRHYIPQSIAVPLYQLCQDMNAPPVTRHCHMVLNNWRLLSPPFEFDKRHTLDNVALNNLFLGGIDENWFFLIAFGIESHFGTVLTSILTIQELVQIIQSNDSYGDDIHEHMKCIQQHLIQISDSVEEMCKLLLRYYEKLDGHVFYRRVRIFLTGSESTETFPHGVELRGVNKSASSLVGTSKIDNENAEYLSLRFNGASAAQASGFPVMDNFLNVDQSDDAFLMQMGLYMPFEHRQFVYWMRDERMNMVQCIQILKAQQELQDLTNTFVEHNRIFKDVSEIVELTNKCISKARKFRSTHMKIVTDMIVKPSSKLQQKTKGTGGTTMIPYLKSVLNRTKLLSRECGEPRYTID